MITPSNFDIFSDLESTNITDKVLNRNKLKLIKK